MKRLFLLVFMFPLFTGPVYAADCILDDCQKGQGTKKYDNDLVFVGQFKDCKSYRGGRSARSSKRDLTLYFSPVTSSTAFIINIFKSFPFAGLVVVQPTCCRSRHAAYSKSCMVTPLARPLRKRARAVPISRAEPAPPFPHLFYILSL